MVPAAGLPRDEHKAGHAPEPVREQSTPGAVGPVTVAVTNFNGVAFLDACLDAVATLRGEVAEVLVIDNASTDESVELIRRHPSAPRLVQLDSNDGPCPARNRALVEADTRWVLQIDSDVIVRPETLEQLWPETAGSQVAAIQPRAVLASDPAVVHYDGGRMHYVGVMCLDHLLERVDGEAGPPEDVGAVISMALLVERHALLEAGGYDEAFFILFEDHDLSYRLRARGWRLRRVPRATVLHREGTVGISYRPGAPAYPERRAFLHARNRAYLVLKNYSWSTLLLTLPGRTVYALVWLAFSIRRGVFLAYLKGRLDLLRLLPRALRLRRRLGSHRVVGDRELLIADDLTFSPVITRRALEARLETGINGTLRVLWRIVRGLVPGRGPLESGRLDSTS